MKLRLFLSVVLAAVGFTLLAQSFTPENSLKRTAILIFKPWQDGYYFRDKDMPVDTINYSPSDIYALDKETKTIYLTNARGNYAVTVSKKQFSTVKKQKKDKILNDNDLELAISSVNDMLSKKYIKLNEKNRARIAREKQIADSIAAEARKKEAARKERLANEQYRKSHKYYVVPINSKTLHCDLCDDSFYKDSIYCLALSADSIAFVEYIDGDLGENYAKVHLAKIPSDLKKDTDFIRHINVFGDSLLQNNLSRDAIEMSNDMLIYDYIENLKKDAPYGYVKSWSWDNEFSVSFNIEYMNTNKKTIKYIDVYWKATNDVDDVRGTGHFKGTGPLEYLESASWDWDYSMYYLAGDTSNMKITKIILTYMNGTKRILTGDNIVCN